MSFESSRLSMSTTLCSTPCDSETDLFASSLDSTELSSLKTKAISFVC